MTHEEVIALSAVEQARLIRTGQLSALELTRIYLDRIERLNPQLNAFVEVFHRSALLDARLKDTARLLGRPLPPFHGVPIGIKDLNLVRFHTTRFGSGVFKLWSPIDDATTTQLRKGGFVILGKLAASEFGAMPITEPAHHGPTRNPWNPLYTAGGSSGGSGAAVAARMLPIAHGSDGGGSVRIPASFNHLYGFKPSRGRLRNQFWLKDTHLLYTCGSLARSVDDAAAMLDVMAGVTAGNPHRLPLPALPFQELARQGPRPLRIHVMVNGPLVETLPEIATQVRRVADVLRSLGHTVEEVPAPGGTLEEFLPIYQKFVSLMPGVPWARTQPVTAWLALAGKKLTMEFVAQRQTEMTARIQAGFTGADAWLLPTVPVLPPAVGAWSSLSPEKVFAAAAELGACTVAFNLLGYPAANLPVAVSNDGRPIGVQLAAPVGEEARVLALSRQIEQALPWSGRQAPLT